MLPQNSKRHSLVIPATGSSCSSERSFLDDIEGAELVQNLMVKLRTPLLIAMLWEHTLFCAKIDNDTGGTSVLYLLQRHVALHESVAKIDDANLDDLLLSAACEQRVDLLLPKLFQLNKVLFKLQSNECPLRQAKGIFRLPFWFVSHVGKTFGSKCLNSIQPKIWRQNYQKYKTVGSKTSPPLRNVFPGLCY